MRTPKPGDPTTPFPVRPAAVRAGRTAIAVELSRTLVTSLVEDAVTAPSMRNAQPWRFVHRASSGTVELHGDPARAMPREDPEHRAVHLGCGAALFCLRVAAAHRGLRPEVRLLPDPSDPWHLADVSMQAAHHRTDALAALRPALRERHTSKSPFTKEPVPARVLEGLCGAAVLEGCRLVVQGAWHADAVLGLVRVAELFRAAGASAHAELAIRARAETSAGSAVAEPVPSITPGPRAYGGAVAVREVDPLRRLVGRAPARFGRNSRIALLGTAGDTPEEWLNAGQAMQRVLLQATLDGLSTSLVSQPLTRPELRCLTRDPVSATGYVHLAIRLGYGPRGRPTPRRDASEVLRFA
ncbi:Acg family FMN-binding oxidoreductase [Streptomyces sp. NPDC058877]|uniref:Acg family FMN-binding oxidoreductase n=1 Tax=Streptomyces sp. NPDC058877 TaxID=3346665 RepID=UPI00368EE83D